MTEIAQQPNLLRSVFDAAHMASMKNLSMQSGHDEQYLDSDHFALEFAYTYSGMLRFCADRDRWMHWNGHVWKTQQRDGGDAYEKAKEQQRELFFRQPEETDEEGKTRRKFSRARYTERSVITNLLKQAQTDPRLAVMSDQLDSQAEQLNTPGGIVNLRTGEISLPDPNQLHSMSTAVSPDYTMEIPRWRTFLHTTFQGDEEMIEYIHRLFGLATIGQVYEHIIPLFHGEGANGKTVMLETVMKLLGDYATIGNKKLIIKTRFEDHDTIKMTLKGKRLVIFSETNADDGFDSAAAKDLSGGGQISGRYMRADEVTFDPTHTMVLMTNDLPNAPADDYGFWRRLRHIPFSHVVPEKNRIVGLQDLLVQEEGPGILAWMVEGAKKFLADTMPGKDGLKTPQRVLDATKEYRESQDHMGQFMSERTEKRPDAKVLTTDFRDQFVAWALANGETEAAKISSEEIGKYLRRKGFVKKASNGKKYYVGLEITVRATKIDN